MLTVFNRLRSNHVEVIWIGFLIVVASSLDVKGNTAIKYFPTNGSVFTNMVTYHGSEMVEWYMLHCMITFLIAHSNTS